MSGEAILKEEEAENDTELNWSVSGISSASGFDPEQYTTRESSVATPDLSNIGRDEIDRLISSVRDLKSSLATISEKTVTPTNSPRPSTENTVIKKDTQQTPPVKDPGSDSSNGKLEQMRRMLRELESSRQLGAKRSLSFQRTQLDDQFQEMNEFLDKCKSSKNEQLELERKRASELEKESLQLRSQIKFQAQEIQKLGNEITQKDNLLLELKSCWAQAVQALNKEREEILAEKTKSEEDFRRLKSEQNEAKNQFYVCQGELEKALLIAAEFKQRLDQDEHIKNELNNQIIKNKDSTNSQITELVQDNTKLQNELEEMRRRLHSAIEDKENYEKLMARERQKFEQERTDFKTTEGQMRLESNKKLKSQEESLHAFYLTQMESILSDKIEALQKYVNEWEKKLSDEKVQALHDLQSQHNHQIESFKKQFSQLEAQIKASEAIHIASKREAEALKGQLESNPILDPFSSSSSSEDEAALASRRSLPNSSKLNNRKLRKSSSSRMSSVTTVMNNLKKRSSLEQELRPHSAGAKLLSAAK